MSNINDSKIIKIIKSLDNNGAQVSLLLNRDSRNKTIIGAFLSILSIFASLALSFPKFLHFINLSDPDISVGTEFSVKKNNSTTTPINFSDSSLFLSISFYSPMVNTTNLQFNDNNFTFVQYLNQLPIICSTCQNNLTKNFMNLCNKKEFDNFQLKSMSLSKSNRILIIFRNISFCFPNFLNGTIEDSDIDDNAINSHNSNDSYVSNILNNKTFSQMLESSLTIIVPINTKSLSDSGMKTNSISRSDSVNLDFSSSQSNSKALSENKQLENPNQSQINPLNPEISQQSQNNTKKQEVTQQNTISNDDYKSNNFPSSSLSSSNEQLSPTTSSIDSPINSDNYSSNSNKQLSPTTASINSPISSDNYSSSNSESDLSKNLKSHSSKSSTKTKLTNINSYLKNPPNSSLRLFDNLEKTLNKSNSQKERRHLQSQLSNQQFQSLQIDSIMMEKINRFRFPKILFIHRSFQINPNAEVMENEPLYENVFNLNILDYRDLITGNPKSYNIFIQQTIIEITKPYYFFSSTTETNTILKVYSIEEDSISSDLNEGAIFSFKAVSEIPKISITFLLFKDWLSEFGSFSTVLALINTILASFYNDNLLKSKIINSLFKFIENNEEDFKKEIYSSQVDLNNYYKRVSLDKVKKKNKKLNSIKNFEDLHNYKKNHNNSKSIENFINKNHIEIEKLNLQFTI